MRILPPVLTLSLCVACSSFSASPYTSFAPQLKNRGPVALSSENPYLAGNVIVAKEMQSSPELKGFVDFHGAPRAIEVTGEFLGPTLLYFFYPENHEQFELESSDTTWIIRGPSIIPREKMKEVEALTKNIAGKPKLVTDANLLSSAKTTKKEAESSAPIVAATETEPETESSTQGFRSPISPEEPRFADAASSGVSKEQKALAELVKQIGSHPAEVTPKGDVVHYVTYPGETLSMIARWYTYERASAPKLARINKLANANKLAIGDTIVIPTYLLKNKSRLSEEAVQALRAH